MFCLSLHLYGGFPELKCVTIVLEDINNIKYVLCQVYSSSLRYDYLIITQKSLFIILVGPNLS